MSEGPMDPSTRAQAHYHGASETEIYVLRGDPVFVFLDNGEETRIDTEPGDYVLVPARTPPRRESLGSG